MKFISHRKTTYTLLALVIIFAWALGLSSCASNKNNNLGVEVLAESGVTPETTSEESSLATSEDTLDINDLITVSLIDEGDLKSVYYGIKGLKLSDIIKMLGINLASGEKLSIDLKSIMEKTMNIDIFRLHTVNVTSDWITVEVTVAGTVEDAIKAANVTLGELDTTNVDLNQRLTEGMNILVFRGVSEDEQKVAEVETPAWFDTQVENEYYEPQQNNDYDWQVEAAAQAAADEAAAAQRAAEEAAAQRAAEEAAAQKAAEEAAAQKAAEEAAAQKAAEEAAAQKAAEEAAAQKAAEEAAAAATERTIVSSVDYETPDNPGHGVRVITYSDGTDEEVDY